MSQEKITTNEAARRLGVSSARVRQMILAGELYAEKFGRDLMIDASALASIKTYGKPGRPKGSVKKTKPEAVST